MVVEGFVAVTALVAACALEPGDYFLINADQKSPALHASYVAMTQTSPEQLGFDPQPREIEQLEQGVQEKLANRTGGAVTLAVGMAKVFASVPGMQTLMAYWYHFVIMFEALFILTLLETGTRVARFVFQEALVSFGIGSAPTRESLLGGPMERELEAGVDMEDSHTPLAPHRPHWILNIVMSIVVCAAWGYLLYMGTLDTLWRMLGIANQLLAAIALAVGTTYLLLHAPKRRYALCTGIPFVFVLVTVLTAGVMSVHSWWVYELPTATPEAAFLLKLLCFLASAMLVMTVLIAADAMRRWVVILFGTVPTRDAEPVAVT
jgi:carbon starvation protein